MVTNQDSFECKQECIPVGCILSAAVDISPAMHAPHHAHPLPHTHHWHTHPCHTCPHSPPCTPLTIHAPSHAYPNHTSTLWCMPPTMNTPLLCMPPSHVCPPATHLLAMHVPNAMHPPPVDRLTDACENNLSATAVANSKQWVLHNFDREFMLNKYDQSWICHCRLTKYVRTTVYKPSFLDYSDCTSHFLPTE